MSFVWGSAFLTSKHLKIILEIQLLTCTQIILAVTSSKKMNMLAVPNMHVSRKVFANPMDWSTKNNMVSEMITLLSSFSMKPRRRKRIEAEIIWKVKKICKWRPYTA